MRFAFVRHFGRVERQLREFFEPVADERGTHVSLWELSCAARDADVWSDTELASWSRAVETRQQIVADQPTDIQEAELDALHQQLETLALRLAQAMRRLHTQDVRRVGQAARRLGTGRPRPQTY